MNRTNEKYFQEFLQAPLNAQDREYLETNRESFLTREEFQGFFSFGTGGIRQIVSLGTNRLNVYNVARLAFATTAHFFREEIQTTSPLVVIGYDPRFSSRPFAYLIYHILSQEKFRVRVFDKPTPTPLVSFAVRELQAAGGIILTASHNPPQYNGYKLMGTQGDQLIYPKDKEVEKKFLNFPYKDIPKDIHTWQAQPVKQEDLLGEDILESYMNRLKKEVFIDSHRKKINILYSPLHGTGGWVFKKVFSELRYVNFSILKDQEKPEGSFSTLESPNPEERSAFEMLLKHGKLQQAELLLATDPDADRIGCATLYKGEYHFLTGNQIGCLLLNFLSQKKARSLSAPYICKTIVTTELQKKIASYYGIETKETLTGFKYISSVLKKDPENYLFGGEESYGYLPVDWVRDKDSVSSGVILSQLAEQKNLIGELNEIYLQHGLYREELFNIRLNEKNMDLITRLKSDFQRPDSFPEQGLFKRKVIDVINLNKSSTQVGKNSGPITQEGKKLYEKLPMANVLQIWLEPEGRITLRPSGTEPKIKLYFSLLYPRKITMDNIEKAKEELKQEVKEISQKFLKFLGLTTGA